MSKTRIIKLLNILREKTDENHPLNSEQLIPLLREDGEQVERKTIYSDIKALNDMGIYIESVKGENTGYYFDDELFENSELRILADAVSSCNFVTDAKSDAVLDKLLSLTNEYNRNRIRKTLSYRRTKSTNEQIFYNIDAIGEALYEKKKITFDYFDVMITGHRRKRREKRYETVPYAIIMQDEKYYLIGYSEHHDDYVHYRIDRMEAIKSEPTEHVYRQLDVQSYIEKHIMMYSGEAVMVRLRCASRFASDVQDQFGSSLVVRSSNDEYFECSVKVVISRLFFSWLLKYGDGIRILSPDSVIEEYKKVCLEVIGQYGE